MTDLVADLAEHIEANDGDGRMTGLCGTCRQVVPCTSMRARDEIVRLRALVDRLAVIPDEHRDEYMESLGLINWLNVYAPGTAKRAKLDGVRDTCDVLGHKLRAAIAEAAPS